MLLIVDDTYTWMSYSAFSNHTESDLLPFKGLANVPGMNPNPHLGHGHNPGSGMTMSSFTIRN